MFSLDQGGAGRGAHAEAAPADLAPWLELGWVDHSTRSGAWRVVPDTSAHLIYCRDARGSRLTLVGPRSRFVDIDSGEFGALLGESPTGFMRRGRSIQDDSGAAA